MVKEDVRLSKSPYSKKPIRKMPIRVNGRSAALQPTPVIHLFVIRRKSRYRRQSSPIGTGSSPATWAEPVVALIAFSGPVSLMEDFYYAGWFFCPSS